LDKVESLFLENYKDLCIYAYYYLKDINEAEDVVQDIFVKIMEHGKIDEIENAKSYLKIAVKNASLKKIHVKRKDRENEQFVSKDSLFYSEQNTEAQELEALKKKADLYKQIDMLPTQCRKIFLLCVLDGLKYKEAADILNISVNTVKTQIKKAFKILRNSLKSIYLALIFVKKRNLKN